MLKLKFSCAPNPRLRPLIDGTVVPKNIALQFVLCSSPGAIFYHNLRYDDFDVSEMSMSDCLIVREKRETGRWRWSGLPVFLSKAFLWLSLSVNTNAGINRGEDFKSKRVAVPDYPMTAALWMRIIFKELFGVRPQDIRWYVGRLKHKSHGEILGLDRKSPAGIALEWLTDDQTMDVMLDKGELDAAFGMHLRSDPVKPPYENVDRYGGTPLNGNPRIRKFFPDGGRQLTTDYFYKSGVLPSNHMVVVQDRILDEHPWVALELYRALQRSKEVAYERARALRGSYLLFEAEDYYNQAKMFGQDPFPLGIKQNLKMLEILFRGSYEEGLTERQSRVEDIFHASTFDT